MVMMSRSSRGKRSLGRTTRRQPMASICESMLSSISSGSSPCSNPVVQPRRYPLVEHHVEAPLRDARQPPSVAGRAVELQAAAPTPRSPPGVKPYIGSSWSSSTRVEWVASSRTETRSAGFLLRYLRQRRDPQPWMHRRDKPVVGGV